MSKINYWPRVFVRAVKDTFLFFGGAKIIWPPILFTVGTGVHLYRSGADAVLEELDIALSYGLITFLIVWAMLFVVNFIVAPPRLEAEAVKAASEMEIRLNKKIDELNKWIFDREKRQQAINELWKLRAEGVEIRNKEISQDDYKGWYEEYADWEQRVLQCAADISINLQKWLHPLDQVRPAPNFRKPSCSVDHQRDRANMSEVLRRVQDFLATEMIDKDIRNLMED